MKMDGANVTLGEASDLFGKAKSTIHKHISSGKVPAEKNPDGSYSIDVEELARFYDKLENRAGNDRMAYAVRKLMRENNRLKKMDYDANETWNGALDAAIRAATPWLEQINQRDQLHVKAAINAILVLRS